MESVGYDSIWEIQHLNKTGILLNRESEGMNVIYFLYEFAREDSLILNII